MNKFDGSTTYSQGKINNSFSSYKYFTVPVINNGSSYELDLSFVTECALINASLINTGLYYNGIMSTTYYNTTLIKLSNYGIDCTLTNKTLKISNNSGYSMNGRVTVFYK